MVYFNEKYEIIAKEATGYSIDSTDNKYYDKCIKVIETDSFAHYSCYEMCVVSFENGEEVSLIVIGSYCSKLFEHSGILEEEIFYLILDNQIVKYSASSQTPQLPIYAWKLGALPAKEVINQEANDVVASAVLRFSCVLMAMCSDPKLVSP